MPYVDNVPHAGSAEVLFTGMFDEFAGTIARTIPRNLVTAGTLACFTTGGQVAAKSIPLAAGMVVSNLAMCFGNTGATGPTHFWMGLTDAQLNVLAVTADQGAAAQAANTLIKVPVTIPVVVQYTGLYYFVASSSASTTAPTGTGANLASGLVSPAPVLAGTAGTQTTPPAIGSQLNGGGIGATASCMLAAWAS